MKKLLFFLIGISLFVGSTLSAQGKPYGPIDNPVVRSQYDTSVQYIERLGDSVTVIITKVTDGMDSVLCLLVYRQKFDGDIRKLKNPSRYVLGKEVHEKIFFSIGDQYFLTWTDEQKLLRRIKI